MFEQTKAKCDEFLELGIPGFDLLVYKDGKEYFRYMGGYRDLENKLPVQGDERYRIYSCTKPITVVAAMQLWEQGKFDLDDLVSDYLPAYKEQTVQDENGIRKATQPMRVRHLFTMTAGFSYDYHTPELEKLAQAEPNPTTRQVADALGKEHLLFEPGDRYNYSLCHDVLGALIEVWSGESFDSYVKHHVFEPLGMDHSTMHLTQEDKSTVAPLYRFDSETKQAQPMPLSDRLGKNYVCGGAGCVTTISDYMKFAEALREGERLLKRSTIALMSTNQLTEHQKRTFTIHNMGYGLGLWAPLPGELRQDIGWGGAAGAMLSVDIGRGLSIVYMQHMLRSPNMPLRGKMVRTFMAEFDGVADARANESGYTANDLTY